ncbi:heat shock protein Hsp20 (plasmid) [Stanieria cyanosphaera PCC 7437]|uniref:Heat shock protein Hsp20 n=1 Tax=Stanieria cyanosphaera (strain ATCC 29371 / PCC 7437) TaxID=111780 RepID=K9Y2B3_STAC7|nr:Hsp20/alpha crystallin family protein [Stanieria cyanosphaera]AFZ38127.1 heat shock protein Hsp20 [Stanieria cyanosphaera PCC 7437]
MSEQNKTWCPNIEFNETDEELILKAELPGVKIEDLIINAQTRFVSISGICNPDKSTDEKEVIPSQFNYGQIKCNTPLPVAIQPEKTRAEFIDGVLTISMPKLRVASAVNF